MSNVRKKCPNCNQIYIGDGYKESCTRECYFKKQYEDMMVGSGRHADKHKVKKRAIYTKICPKCNSEFETNTQQRKYCSFGCSDNSKTTEQEKINKANERWLQDKPKYMPKNRKSYAQLDREAEWRRVWDDDTWTRNYRSYRG